MAPKRKSTGLSATATAAAVAAAAPSDGSDLRSAASSQDSLPPVSTNERILQDVQSLYLDRDAGLKRICEELQVPGCQHPRKTITVMIIGNHSAGKSSFINWYTGYDVQSVGVAIETQGFTFVMPGKKKETLKGPATRHLFPQLHEIAAMPGLMENLSTEIIVPGPRPNAHLITFLDTPGLVDGSMAYPFDVDTAIVKLAEFVDLILVFMDPIGQALCARTMNIVKQLNERYGQKLRFYLSKADTVPNESDRQKVLIQITQNLSHYLKNRTFSLPTIYIPVSKPPPISGPSVAEERAGGTVANHLDELCEDLDKTVQLVVQGVLTALERDCTAATAKCNAALDTSEHNRRSNRKRFAYRLGVRALCITLAVTLLLAMLYSALDLVWPSGLRMLQAAAARQPATLRMLGFTASAAEYVSHQTLIAAVVGLPLLWFGSGWLFRKRRTLSKIEFNRLLEYKAALERAALTKNRLYDDFFRPLVDQRHV